MRIASGCWFGLLMLCAACGRVENEGTVRQPIVGGSVDTTARFPTVFVLKIQRTGGQQNGCTGTLITPRTLLTAAHCLPSDVAKVFVTNVTPAPSMDPSFVESTDWRRHPSWVSGSPADFDIGLVLLPAASTLKPTPYARASLATFAGKPLTAVGYGLTLPGATDNGTRRFVDLTFRSVTAAHVVLGNTVDKGICFGDSGGPSLHTFPDGIARVVGIHSYTQPASSCTDGLDTRVDLFGPFIRTWLTDKEGGATCVEDGLCKMGCAPEADPDCVCVADGTCSAACANLLSDPDCPPDCAMNAVCTNLACPKPDPDCVAELAACTMAAQCASRLCTPDPQRSPEQYCTRACPAGATCAGGTQCVAGACLKPQKPSVAPGATCTGASDFCLGGTSCLSVPSGGLRCSKSCTTTASCPAPTTCTSGFCIGADVMAANPGERCVQATTFCTGNTVCAGLASLGPPTCAQPCGDDPDCSAGKKCLQGVGGVRYCEKDFIVVPHAGEHSVAAAPKTGCASAGGPLALFALLLTLPTGRRRRRPAPARPSRDPTHPAL